MRMYKTFLCLCMALFAVLVFISCDKEEKIEMPHVGIITINDSSIEYKLNNMFFSIGEVMTINLIKHGDSQM